MDIHISQRAKKMVLIAFVLGTLGVLSCAAIEKNHCLHASVDFAEISRPNPEVGVPSISHWALLDFPGHPRTRVIPIPGKESIKVDGRHRSLTLPSGEAFTLWGIAEYSDTEFIASGWVSSPENAVLAMFTIEWDGPVSRVRCLEVLFEGDEISGTSVIGYQGEFPQTLVLFDQQSHAVLYFNLHSKKMGIVLSPRDYPQLCEMAFLFVAVGENHVEPPEAILWIELQHEVTSGRKIPICTHPFGQLLDDGGDGVFEEIYFSDLNGPNEDM
jgi:hypothetical protein